MLNPFRSETKSFDLAIDLGTSKTAIFMKGEGVIFDEPTLISYNIKKSGNTSVIAIGHEAVKLRGKEPQNIKTIKPLQGGVIEQLEATKALLSHVAKVNQIHRRFYKPKVLIGAPYATSVVERKAVFEAAKSIHPKRIKVIEEPLASAIGAGMDVSNLLANMIVDIGSGITEVVIISSGRIVRSESCRIGGDAISQALMQHIRRHFDFIIGESTADYIKSMFCQIIDSTTTSFAIKGIDIPSRLPQSRLLNPTDLTAAMKHPIQTIISTIKRTFENTPPQLVGDLVDRGILLTGGTSLLKGFDRLIEEAIGIPVVVAKDPLRTVVDGAGQLLENRQFIGTFMA